MKTNFEAYESFSLIIKVFYNMRCFVMFITAVYMLFLTLRYFCIKKHQYHCLLNNGQRKQMPRSNKSRVYKTKLENIQ